MRSAPPQKTRNGHQSPRCHSTRRQPHCTVWPPSPQRPRFNHHLRLCDFSLFFLILSLDFLFCEHQKVLLVVTGEVEIYDHVNFFPVVEEFTLTSLWLVLSHFHPAVIGNAIYYFTPTTARFYSTFFRSCSSKNQWPEKLVAFNLVRIEIALES
jgi:hypothetical protein